MKFTHTFRVRAAQETVAEFHRSAASLRAITPPVIPMRIHAAPPRMNDGDTTDFTMWLGPLPVRWVARVDQISGAGFVDRQEQGPFQLWVHTHRFVAVDATTTDVQDSIEAELGVGFTNRLKSLLMWLGLPFLFAFRGWQTRRLLEKQ